MTWVAYMSLLQWEPLQNTLHHQPNNEESIMKRSYKVAATLTAALGMGLAAVAFANPGAMGEATGSGMGPGMGRGMAMHGGSTGQAKGQAMGHQAMGHQAQGHQAQGRQAMGEAADHAAIEQIMTPDERTALMEKMRSAKTPEDRQQLAQATRTEMQKRANEKGITLPEQRGPQGRAGVTPGHTH